MKGFTLIELMIVVAILVILAASVVPEFQEVVCDTLACAADKQRSNQLP